MSSFKKPRLVVTTRPTERINVADNDDLSLVAFNLVHNHLQSSHSALSMPLGARSSPDPAATCRPSPVLALALQLSESTQHPARSEFKIPEMFVGLNLLGQKLFCYVVLF